jgi:hypothetical protein
LVWAKTDRQNSSKNANKLNRRQFTLALYDIKAELRSWFGFCDTSLLLINLKRKTIKI